MSPDEIAGLRTLIDTASSSPLHLAAPMWAAAGAHVPRLLDHVESLGREVERLRGELTAEHRRELDREHP